MKWGLILFAVAVLVGYNLYDDFDPEQLKDKNVVITGGSEGIGEQLAYMYARLGARILITSRTESKLKKVVEQCRKEGNENGVYLYHVADMMDSNAGNSLIKAAEEKLGGIDFLVLNHIIPAVFGVWKSSAENLTLVETTMNINYFAYVRVASAAMNSLRHSNGSIVVVSSVAAKVPQPFIGSYSASKFALDGFFGALRQEFFIEDVGIAITMCYIALTNTTSAVANLMNFPVGIKILKNVYIAPPQDVATAIVHGATRQQNFVYYPYSYGRIATLVYNFVPSIIEHIQCCMVKT